MSRATYRKLSPDHHAERHPDHPALLADDGHVVTFGEITDRSRRAGQLLRQRGLRVGDHIAVLTENNTDVFEIVLGAIRAGLYVTPINWHLTVPEAAYIAENCGARALFTSPTQQQVARDVLRITPGLQHAFCLGGRIDGFDSYDEEVASCPPEPLRDETEGAMMFYSSGTTGVPKGIIRPLSGEPFGTGTNIDREYIGRMWGDVGVDVVHLNPGPIYHAATLAWSIAFLRHGHANVVMRRFDPEQTLAMIERHRVTHAHFVPTHFVRMLKLAREIRERYDLSSLRVVQHAAAPCPVDVKRGMLDWLGPIIHEYCGGSEDIVYGVIGPQEWLEHPGSVGQAAGRVHVLDDEGRELPAGETGTLWVEGVKPFAYHGEPEKTRSVFNDKGWATVGDLGRLDDDGYLYMRDRRPHLILSGGVNIYPQEIEDVLITHDAVFDVAVVGVPNEEFGEEVKAVVVRRPGLDGDPRLESELIEFCRSRLAHYKCPRSVDFVDWLPRTDAGKLRKHIVQEAYWTRRRDGSGPLSFRGVDAATERGRGG